MHIVIGYYGTREISKLTFPLKSLPFLFETFGDAGGRYEQSLYDFYNFLGTHIFKQH